MYKRKPLGTIIHAVALIASSIAIAYGLHMIYDLVIFLSSKEPSDTDGIAELVIGLLILAILIGIFFVIVSFLYLFTPNLIMSMYKSRYRHILFAFHTFFSAWFLLFAIKFIFSPHKLSMFDMLWIVDAIFLSAAGVSMWLGVDNPLFPWKTTPSKSEQIV